VTRQAVAGWGDKTNEMTMQLGIYREATWAFVKVKSDVSQALYNIITLATIASRGFHTQRDMRYETILPRHRNGGT
jgi:hypothetical protein